MRKRCNKARTLFSWLSQSFQFYSRKIFLSDKVSWPKDLMQCNELKFPTIIESGKKKRKKSSQQLDVFENQPLDSFLAKPHLIKQGVRASKSRVYKHQKKGVQRRVYEHQKESVRVSKIGCTCSNLGCTSIHYPVIFCNICKCINQAAASEKHV